MQGLTYRYTHTWAQRYSNKVTHYNTVIENPFIICNTESLSDLQQVNVLLNVGVPAA